MLDPGSLMAIKAGGGWLAKKFSSNVIDRWARWRAEVFFATFVEKLAELDASGAPVSDLEPLLAECLESETKSEALFDAYRRVCLSASSTLGPRIIAVLTARLVSEGRKATADEERLFMVAETFGDSDLLEFAGYLRDNKLKDMKIELFDESEDSNYWGRDQTVMVGPMNLSESVGNWCVKLANCGLVVQEIEKKSWRYQADSERHVDEDGTATKYTWNLVFQEEVLDLRDIIEELKPTVAGQVR